MDLTIAQRFRAEYWADPENPSAFITDDCPGLKQELPLLQMQKTRSAAVDKYKNRAEKIQQKNNHAWDAVCYAIAQRPHKFVPGQVGTGYMTVDEFIKRAELQKAPLRARNSRGSIVVN
jgi:hypothetical protein